MSSTFLILVGSFAPMISTLNFTSSPPSLSLVSQTASGTSPSWLLSNPSNSSIVYATDETDTGALNSLVLDHFTGKLTSVASIPTQGGSPTHIGLVNNGTQLGVANYGGSSAFFTTLDQDLLHFNSPQLISFGTAGSSNAHQVVPSGDQVLVSDLGADRVWRLGKGGSGNWSVQDFITQPAGSGPRHLVLDDGTLYSLHEKANTLTQQSIPSTPLSDSTQPDPVASISIVPSDTPAGAPLVAGELLFAQTPTPLIYASNRDDPSALGDAIAIFDINPLTKVAEVRTGLQHLRGVALVGENNAYLIAGGMKGGGIKIYERVSADQGYLKEVASLAPGVVDQPSSFVWVPAQNTPSPVAGSTPTTTVASNTSSSNPIRPTTSHSAGRRRFKIGI